MRKELPLGKTSSLLIGLVRFLALPLGSINNTVHRHFSKGLMYVTGEKVKVDYLETI